MPATSSVYAIDFQSQKVVLTLERSEAPLGASK